MFIVPSALKLQMEKNDLPSLLCIFQRYWAHAWHLKYPVTFLWMIFLNVIETGEEFNVLGGRDSKGQDTAWRQSSWSWRICTECVSGQGVRPPALLMQQLSSGGNLSSGICRTSLIQPSQENVLLCSPPHSMYQFNRYTLWAHCVWVYSAYVNDDNDELLNFVFKQFYKVLNIRC